MSVEAGNEAGRARAGATGERLADQAYRRLRDEIVTVALRPGEPLDEKALSARLGLGLTPIRDALKRLTLERLAVIYPRRGTFVSEINISDEASLTEVRIQLEGLAAGLAAERASPAERRALLDLAEDFDTASGPAVDYIELDGRIHRAIYAAARNPFLEFTLNQYANLALRIWHFGLQERGRRDHVCSQRRVVEAVAAGDVPRARAAAEEHLRGFSDEVRSMLRPTTGHPRDTP